MMNVIHSFAQRFGDDFGAFFGRMRLRFLYPRLGKRMPNAVIFPFCDSYYPLLYGFRKFFLDIDPASLEVKDCGIFTHLPRALLVYKVGKLSPVIDVSLLEGLKEAGWFLVGVFHGHRADVIRGYPADLRIIEYDGFSFCTTNLYYLASYLGFFDENVSEVLVRALLEHAEDMDFYDKELINSFYNYAGVFASYSKAPLLDAIIYSDDLEEIQKLHGRLYGKIYMEFYKAPPWRAFGGFDFEAGRLVFNPPDGLIRLQERSIIIPNHEVGKNFSFLTEALNAKRYLSNQQQRNLE